MFPRIKPYSRVAFPIQMTIDNKVKIGDKIEIAIGTGFLYIRKQKIFLVSNWHNFSGYDFIGGRYTKENKDRETAALPEYFEIQSIFPNSGSLCIPLSNGDEKRWFFDQENPVDIGILELTKDECEKFNALGWDRAINDRQFPDLQNMTVEITDDVYIIGYPYGKNASNYMVAPIFKRGTIASEPDLSFYDWGRDSMVIDATTRPGMSGSPVVAIKKGVALTENWQIIINNKAKMRFLGIYSGRIDADNDKESCLGIVWRKRLIDDLIDKYLLEQSL